MDLLKLQYGILGNMMLFPEHVGEIMTRLGVADFDSVATRGLFEAIGHLHFAGKSIDPVTVELEAGDGYGPAVEQAMDNPAGDWSYYCDLLREGMQLKQIHSCANDLGAVDTMAAAGKVIDRINGLACTRQRAEIVTAHEAATDFVLRMSREVKPEYLTLGIPEVDRLLFIEPGDFILIGGYASSGKTLLSLQFALTLAEKYRVGYFSLETNTRKLTDRLISHMAQVPLAAIKDCCLDPENARRAAEASRKLGKMPLDLISAGGMSVRDIQAITLNKRYQVIFVDYLQIVSDPGKSRYEQVTNISIALHTLAQSHHVVVFALAQLSRPDKAKNNGLLVPPSMSAFRESGQLEQDADVALLLWPEDPKQNKSDRVLKIAKNKDGGRDTFTMKFNGATQTLSSAVSSLKPVVYQYNDEMRKAQESLFKSISSKESSQFDG